MKKIVSKDLDFDSQLEDILSLDRGIPSDIGETVKNIIEDVKDNGDAAVIKLTNILDNNNDKYVTASGQMFRWLGAKLL